MKLVIYGSDGTSSATIDVPVVVVGSGESVPMPVGQEGQLIGYGADGRLVAVDAPEVLEPFDPQPVINRLGEIETALADLPEPPDLEPIVDRLTTVEQTLSEVGAFPDLAPVLERISDVEQGLEGKMPATTFKTVGGATITGTGNIAIPPAYDDTSLRAVTQDLASRVGLLEGSGAVNRAPLVTAAPVQALTVGSDYAADFRSNFVDPDFDELTFSLSGSLPAGIAWNGESFTGRPTAAGTSTVVMKGMDPVGAFGELILSFVVAAAVVDPPPPVPLPSLVARQDGFDILNPGTIAAYKLNPAVGGFDLETI